MKLSDASPQQLQRIRDLALDMTDELEPFEDDDTNVATEISNLAFLIAGCRQLLRDSGTAEMEF